MNVDLGPVAPRGFTSILGLGSSPLLQSIASFYASQCPQLLTRNHFSNDVAPHMGHVASFKEDPHILGDTSSGMLQPPSILPSHLHPNEQLCNLAEGGATLWASLTLFCGFSSPAWLPE
jgi:hypothetical protein